MDGISVYDIDLDDFRHLEDKSINPGFILFERESLLEIKKWYTICGYILICKKNGICYPIDIQNDKLVIFEPIYIEMPNQLKASLVKYNITIKPDKIWSAFFIQWQLMGDSSAFEQYGPFIKLCRNILCSGKRFKDFIKADISIYEPTTYKELCDFTRNIIELSNVNIFDYDYYTSKKYLIDSLVKGYHIKFTSEEITSYFWQISSLIDERWEK